MCVLGCGLLFWLPAMQVVGDPQADAQRTPLTTAQTPTCTDVWPTKIVLLHHSLYTMAHILASLWMAYRRGWRAGPFRLPSGVLWPRTSKHDAAQHLHPVASCLWVTVESYDRAEARTLWHAQTDIHGLPTLAMNIVKLTVVARK